MIFYIPITSSSRCYFKNVDYYYLYFAETGKSCVINRMETSSTNSRSYSSVLMV